MMRSLLSIACVLVLSAALVSAANEPSGLSIPVASRYGVYMPFSLGYLSLSGSTLGRSFAVTPSLPVGLSLNSTTGLISGTPTAITSSTTYTYNVTNDYGWTSDDITFAIVTYSQLPPYGFSYALSTFTLYVGELMSAIVPTISGPYATKWTISPNVTVVIPGISFSSTGVFRGTPQYITHPFSTFTVTASNANGAVSTTITLQVIRRVPTCTVPLNSISFVNATDITPGIAISGLGTAPLTYSVSPALPAGLYLSSAGVILGTPKVVVSGTIYTFTISNAAGTGTCKANISVQTTTVSARFSYPGAPFNYPPSSGSAVWVPTVQGTGPLVFSVSSTTPLPSGLSIDTYTGVISGNPLAVSSGSYTIVLNNPSSRATRVIQIVVTAVTPTVTYTPSQFKFTIGHAVDISPVVLPAIGSASGGNYTFTVTSGGFVPNVTVDAATGRITGTPTTWQDKTVYTLSASNSQGSTTVQLTIAVGYAASSVDSTIVEFIFPAPAVAWTTARQTAFFTSLGSFLSLPVSAFSLASKSNITGGAQAIDVRITVGDTAATSNVDLDEVVEYFVQSTDPSSTVFTSFWSSTQFSNVSPSLTPQYVVLPSSSAAASVIITSSTGAHSSVVNGTGSTTAGTTTGVASTGSVSSTGVVEQLGVGYVSESHSFTWSSLAGGIAIVAIVLGGLGIIAVIAFACRSNMPGASALEKQDSGRV